MKWAIRIVWIPVLCFSIWGCGGGGGEPTSGGRIRDASSGGGIPGATVRIGKVVHGGVVQWAVTANTDAQGNYAFTLGPLPPVGDQVDILVTAVGYSAHEGMVVVPAPAAAVPDLMLAAEGDWGAPPPPPPH